MIICSCGNLQKFMCMSSCSFCGRNEFCGGNGPVLIFWSMMTLFFFRLSSRESHFRSSTMAVTLFVLLKFPKTYLAALLWTFSSSLDNNFCPGDHTVDAYSSVGLTKDLYAHSLVDCIAVLKFLLTKASIRLPLAAAFPTSSSPLYLYQESCGATPNSLPQTIIPLSFTPFTQSKTTNSLSHFLLL